MLISHDLRVIGKLADRVLIMQDGNIVETMDLKQDMLHADDDGSADKKHKKGAELSEEDCILRFGTPKTDYGRKLLDAAFSKKQYRQKGTGKTLVKAEHLSVSYKMASRKQKGLKKVIDDVSFEIKEGSTAGIVGESGSGKSTLVKAIAGLQKYVDGKLEISCGRPSMVFQDPYSSLNPAFKVRRILEEPLRLKNGFGRSVKKKNRDRMLTEIKAMLHKTELEEEILNRKISELSGGQRQRIAIALTLIQKKSLIILDEPVSALDVTIQEQILDLLMKLKKAFGLTYILISHDMRLVSRVCDEVFVIEDGKIRRG